MYDYLIISNNFLYRFQEFYKKNRKVILFSISMAIATFFFFSYIVFPLYAKKTYDDIAVAIASKIVSGNSSTVLYLFNVGGSTPTGVADTAVGGNFKTFITSLMGGANSTDGIWAEGYMKTITTLFKSLGGMLVIIITLAHLFNAIEREQDSMEMVFKTLVEMMLSLLFVLNLDGMIKVIFGLFTAILTEISGSMKISPATSNVASSILKALNGDGSGYGIFDLIVTVLILGLPWLISFLIELYTVFLAIGMAIEVAIRRVFAPIAVADIYKEGWNSPGARYLKKLFASLLKIIAAVVISFMCARIQNNISTSIKIDANYSSNVGQLINLAFSFTVIQLACAGAIAKCDSVVNDAVGA